MLLHLDVELWTTIKQTMGSQTYEVGLCDGTESLLVKHDNKLVAAYAQQSKPRGRLGTHPIGKCDCRSKPPTLNWLLGQVDVALSKLLLLGIIGVPVKCYTSGDHAVVVYKVKCGVKHRPGLVFMCCAGEPVILAHRMHGVCVYNDPWAVDVLSHLDRTEQPIRSLVKQKENVDYVHIHADVEEDVHGKRPMRASPLKLIKGIDLADATEQNIEPPARFQQLQSRSHKVFPENKDQRGSQSQPAPHPYVPQAGGTAGLRQPQVFLDDDYAVLYTKTTK